MIGYILTEEQYTQIQGQYYTEFQFFNCVQNIDGVWFLILSTQDKQDILETQWEWILTLPEGEYIAPVPPPFPPTV